MTMSAIRMASLPELCADWSNACSYAVHIRLLCVWVDTWTQFPEFFSSGKFRELTLNQIHGILCYLLIILSHAVCCLSIFCGIGRYSGFAPALWPCTQQCANVTQQYLSLTNKDTQYMIMWVDLFSRFLTRFVTTFICVDVYMCMFKSQLILLYRQSEDPIVMCVSELAGVYLIKWLPCINVCVIIITDVT